MKKMFAMVMALVMVLACLAVSSFAEEDKTLYPEYSLDMETFDKDGDCMVYASLSSDAIDAMGVMVLDIYAYDMYPVEALKALQVGDTILLDNKYVTVQSLEWQEDGAVLLINGGDFESGQGYTLCFLDDSGDTDHMFNFGCDDMISMTMRGQAAYLLGDEVTVTSFHWNEDGQPDDEPVVKAMPGYEVPDYLKMIEETEMITFNYTTTTVRIVDQKIVEISTFWAPWC